MTRRARRRIRLTGLAARRTFLCVQFLLLSGCMPLPTTNAYKGSDLVVNRPRLDDETKRLIRRLTSSDPASAEQHRLAGEVAKLGAAVIPEMVLLDGKRDVIPFLPPGPTWEHGFFVKRNFSPYSNIASEVISQIRDPSAVPSLHRMIGQKIMPYQAALGLQAMNAPMSAAELEVLFPSWSYADWSGLLGRVTSLPKEESARLLARYLDGVTMSPQLEGGDISKTVFVAKLLGCSGGQAIANLAAQEVSAAARIVPIPEDDFRRYRDVAVALRKVATTDTVTCLGSRLPALKIAAQKVAAESATTSEYAANYPVDAVSQQAQTARAQLGAIISDYEEIIRGGAK